MTGVVATGHPLTSAAAKEMFSLGGNAFDAGIAAGFASVVTEPTLTSLGGGGFCLAHTASKSRDILFDFFVNTPGLNRSASSHPEMIPVNIKFPGCTQVFHTGYASVAVPGMLKGLLHIHKRLCSLPLNTILRPAIRYLEEGVEINERQEIFLSLLEPIMLSSDYGKKIFRVNGRYLRQHDILKNPELAEFFRQLKDDTPDLYNGPLAERLVEEIQRHNGLITMYDLDNYKVIEREPLRIKYRDKYILTNPPPSLGGIKLALSLCLLNELDFSGYSPATLNYLITLIELMMEMYELKDVNELLSEYPFSENITTPIFNRFRESLSSRIYTSGQGTTHISIIDDQGNALSMTTSNGSGSGCFIPGTGIMLNNMMGEDDLHPGGFFSSPAGQRVGSMMLPTMITQNGKVESVMGSGGSKRIRTAILQTIINITDFKMSLEDAIESPRVHYEDGTVHIEPGIAPQLIMSLQKYYKIRLWDKKDMYFGGVHCVDYRMNGWGDSRRGGSCLLCH